MARKKQRKNFKEIMTSKWGGYLAIIFVFILLSCIFPDKNIFTLISKKMEYKRQNEQIRELQKKIIDTHQQIHSLTDDPETLENYAREQFHFAKPGEDVYLLDQ